MATPRKADYYLFKNTRKGNIDEDYLRRNKTDFITAYTRFMGTSKSSLKIGYSAAFGLEYTGKNKTESILSVMFFNVENCFSKFGK